MKKECILLESEYLNDGKPFQEVLKDAIISYLKNNSTYPRQILPNELKYK